VGPAGAKGKENDTMAAREETLLAWLRDAHAMEHQAIEMMEKMAPRLENYPQLRARIEEHLAETHRQADQLLKCIERHGGGASSLKDMAGKVIGSGQALSGLFMTDEVVKGGIASYAFEHYEMACYKVLIATAEEAGDQETKRVCEQIHREEEAMASWLGDHLPQISRQYLQREAAGQSEAKR
jgi:ferritin-like metal-binding protein YciE